MSSEECGHVTFLEKDGGDEGVGGREGGGGGRRGG